MNTHTGIAKWKSILLWVTVFIYAQSRICQMYPDLISIQIIVFMQVVPLAIFALVHGSIRYGIRGICVFSALCLGVGALCESLSLRTGFPFGHYFFTGLMGPKILQVPILLVLAYLGIGYCSWILSLLILGFRNKIPEGTGLVAAPILASLIMLAWDLSMEAIWSTLDKAWIWRDGGTFFGVPLSNFLGWYFTAFLFYQAFALYCKTSQSNTLVVSRSYWRAVIVCYGVCATGNLMIFRPGLFPSEATDAAGKHWITSEILSVCVLISIFMMIPFALLAWRSLRNQECESIAV